MDWSYLLPRCLPLLVALATPARAANSPDLLLEVRLERHLLSDSIVAYQQGNDVLLPLGELARLLTIAIRVDAPEGQASGYILDEQRGFRLDLSAHSVLRGEQRASFDPALVRREGADIYVASRLLATWLPVGLELDMASLSLQVTAREKLPVQARLERQSKGPMASVPGVRSDPGYPRVATPYSLASMPFIDQTIGLDVRRAPGSSATRASLTTYLTADLLGSEAALYINTGQDRHGPAARLTLGRHDPGAGLLGPIRARTVQAGSVVAPGVPNIALGSANGNGVLLSNRPLGQPMRFDRHNFQGDLAPGWDVELYFNDALVAFQQARPDGRYSFDNQVLIYGANEFRLVFHGPLGQVRIERHSFLIEQSMLAPGELVYSLAAQRDDDGRARAALQFDWGIGKRLSASAALVRMPAEGGERRYASAGLQAYLDKIILHAALVRDSGDGALSQVGMRTRIGGVALNASRAWMRDFASDFYQAGGDPVATRDELRIDGQLAALPVALLARRDRRDSGQENLELGARLSAYRYGTAFSNALRWQSTSGRKQADGVLQVSRRVAGVGLSGQLQYTLEPRAALSALAVSADQHLDAGYMVNLGVARTFSERHYRLSAALNKSMGRFGLGVNAYHAGRAGYGLGLQLFIAAGQEPRRGRWLVDAAPMAGSGSASLRVFLDKNRNGIMDGGEPPIAGAGFVLNGGSTATRTGEDGIAWLARLPASQELDIALDPSTLEDPQWLALQKGMRIVPRAGKASALDFAVGITGEIDGTTYLLANGVKRPAGDLELQLVDGAMAVVASTTSSADGYYILAGVAPGAYTLRIAPAQLARLGLNTPPPRAILIDADGNFLNGKDFTVTPSPP
ncbi:MAG: hypothetical protein V4631_17045 [Pseudomonadota bacterium]